MLDASNHRPSCRESEGKQPGEDAVWRLLTVRRGRFATPLEPLLPSSILSAASGALPEPAGVPVESSEKSPSDAIVDVLRAVAETWGLGAMRPRRLCEIACGNGCRLLEVCRALPSYRGLGIDESPELLQEARVAAQGHGVEKRCEFTEYNRVLGAGGENGGLRLTDVTALLLSGEAFEVRHALRHFLPHAGIQPGTLVLRAGEPAPRCRYLNDLNGQPPWDGVYRYAWRRGQVADAASDESEDDGKQATVLEAGEGTDASLSPKSVRTWRVHRPRTIKVRPQNILFSNSRVASHFSCGRSLDETIDGLRDGSVLVGDIPPITVVQRGDNLLTLNHRRLYAFRRGLPQDAEVEVRLLEKYQADTCHVPLDCRGQSSVYVDARD